MYEYAVEWNGRKSAEISSLTISTTPRRKVRESSLGSGGADDDRDAPWRRDDEEAAERVRTAVSLGGRHSGVVALESPHAGVEFAMAVRAEHHAFEQLRGDGLPRPSEAVS